jgi:hypothetical protein
MRIGTRMEPSPPMPNQSGSRPPPAFFQETQQITGPVASSSSSPVTCSTRSKWHLISRSREEIGTSNFLFPLPLHQEFPPGGGLRMNPVVEILTFRSSPRRSTELFCLRALCSRPHFDTEPGGITRRSWWVTFPTMRGMAGHMKDVV